MPSFFGTTGRCCTARRPSRAPTNAVTWCAPPWPARSPSCTPPPHKPRRRRRTWPKGNDTMDADLRDAAKEYLVRYGGDVFPNLFRSAKGTIVRDSHGREYLDFTSGQMCATIGHNHPAIVAAVHRAGEKAFHFFSGMIPEVVAELARTLAHDWLPGDLKRTIFINTGSEATEVALRMAKMYTGGYEILVLGGSWHGITGGASTVS